MSKGKFPPDRYEIYSAISKLSALYFLLALGLLNMPGTYHHLSLSTTCNRLYKTVSNHVCSVLGTYLFGEESKG